MMIDRDIEYNDNIVRDNFRIHKCSDYPDRRMNDTLIQAGPDLGPSLQTCRDPTRKCWLCDLGFAAYDRFSFARRLGSLRLNVSDALKMIVTSSAQ